MSDCPTLTRPIAAAPRRPGLFARLRAFMLLARQRRRLAALDDRMLDDIGLDRDAALAEAARPIWDVPAHWRL